MLTRLDGVLLQGQMRAWRGRDESGGEAAAKAGHGQVPDGTRDPRASPSWGVQRGLRGAPQAPPDPSTRQEALQDWDPQVGHLLHSLPQSRPRRLARQPPVLSVYRPTVSLWSTPPANSKGLGWSPKHRAFQNHEIGLTSLVKWVDLM